MALDALTTARLRAVRLEAAHLDTLRQMDGDPDFTAMLGGIRDAARTDAYLALNLRHWETHGFGVYILHDRQGDDVVGRAVLRHIALGGRDEVEVGYALFAPWRGRGLATEIATALLSSGFEALALPSIVGVTLPVNHASQRVLTKIGMRFERNVMHAGTPHLLYRRTR